jgi:hypothetical protein
MSSVNVGCLMPIHNMTLETIVQVGDDPATCLPAVVPK